MKPTQQEIDQVMCEENEAMLAFVEAMQEQSASQIKLEISRKRFNDARDAKRALTNDLLAL